MKEEELIRLARKARETAYAPYSHFTVGAALLAEDGTVYLGCNIENGAFSPSNCAERTAFFKAISEGIRKFKAIAIVGAKDNEDIPNQLCPPCGVCLQVMAEFCDSQTFSVVLSDGIGKYQSYFLKDLLPYGFRLS